MFRIKSWDETNPRPFELGIGFAEQSRQNVNWVTLRDSDQRLAVPKILENWRLGNSILMLSHFPDGDWVKSVEKILSQEFQSGLHLAVTTSGSTGEPKVVVHEVARLFKAAKAMINHLNINKVPILDFFHPLYTAGVLNNLVLAMELEVELVLFEKFNFQSPQRLVTWLNHSEDYFNFWLSPKMSQVLITVMRHNSKLRKNLSNRLLTSLSATGPLSKKIQSEFEMLCGSRLINTYGTTEHLFIATELQSEIQGEGHFQLMENVKSNLKDIEMASDEKVGTLEINTAYQARMVIETKQGNPRTRVLSDGELTETGDLARLNGKQLSLFGRTDSLVVSSGLNVSLELLQRSVCDVEEVSDCLAIEFHGRIFLIAESGVDPEVMVRNLRKAIQKTLPTEYQPRKIQVVNELPRTFSGKVDRQAILQNYSLREMQ